MTTIVTNASAARPTRGRWLVAASLLAAAMMLTAPAAYALSENAIKEDCQAQGGKYSTYVAANGNRISQCCVHDKWRPGGWLCEYYVNGQFDGQQDWSAGSHLPPTPADAYITGAGANAGPRAR